MIITTIVSLYLTRVVLDYLGASDFGLYSLIGGVISLLSFVNSALMVSTQRFLSVAIGEKNKIRIKKIFSSSILIHLVLSLILVAVFELCSLFLFDGFLNINDDRLYAAKIVYQLMILSTVFTVCGVPFNAMINAKEDLWLFSIVEAVCTLLKIFVILLFKYSQSDALVVYTLWILLVTIVNFFLKYVWCKYSYNECKISLSIKKNSSLIKEMIGFSGWNALGTLALIGRNQGVAIILNIFWGTAINAVYGIANQVNSQLIYFSTMMTTSMTPQIMKSYGEGNRSRLLDLSVFTCKLSFFLSAVFAIPLLLELDFVLKLWLQKVPIYTETFCSLIVFMFLFMQLYPGLNRAIQACGRIKFYQLITSVILLIPIPIGAFIGKAGEESYFILYIMIISQIIQMFVAIFIARRLVDLDVNIFLKFILKSIISFIVIYCSGKLLRAYCLSFYNEWITFFIVSFVTMSFFSFVYYFFVFEKNDRNKVNGLAKVLFSKKK